MRWLWILGIIVCLFAIFCLLPLGVQILFGQPATVKVILGPVRLQVAPSKEKKKKEKKAKKQPEKGRKPPAILEKMKKDPKAVLHVVRSAYRALWPSTKRALHRLLHGIHLHPLNLSVTIAGRNDPAGAAEIYGLTQDAVWTVMPVLREIFVIPSPKIHVGLDFESEKTGIEGELGMSMRIGTLLAVGFEVGIPALIWLIKNRKELKNQFRTRDTAPAEHPAA